MAGQGLGWQRIRDVAPRAWGHLTSESTRTTDVRLCTTVLLLIFLFLWCENKLKRIEMC